MVQPANKRLVTEASPLLARKAAAPTGVPATDNASIMAVHALLPAAGGQIVLQPGNYAVTGLTFTKRVQLLGEGGAIDYTTGLAATTLTCKSATARAIDCQTAGSTLKDFAVICTAPTPTAGSTGIYMTAGNFARLSGVTVKGFYNDVDWATGFYWKMTDCDILDPVNYGAYLHNTTPSSDWGDPSIEGCTFTMLTPRFANAAVRWEAGGGLRFANNKINGGLSPDGSTAAGTFTYGLDVVPVVGTNTADLLVTGNSMENCSTADLHFGGSTSGSFAGYTVVSNEFGFGVGSAIGILFDPGVVGKHVNGVIISNVFNQLATGISIATTQGLTVGPNRYYGVTTPVLIGTGNVDLAIDAGQQFRNGDGLIFSDTSANSDQNGAGAKSKIRHEYEREIPNTTTTATYATLWKVALPTYGGLVLEVTAAGNGSGASPYVGFYKRLAQIGGGGPANLATVGTDATLPAAATSFPVEVFFDPGIVSGEVHIKVRQHAGAGMTGIAGRVTLRVDGIVQSITRGP